MLNDINLHEIILIVIQLISFYKFIIFKQPCYNLTILHLHGPLSRALAIDPFAFLLVFSVWLPLVITPPLVKVVLKEPFVHVFKFLKEFSLEVSWVIIPMTHVFVAIFKLELTETYFFVIILHSFVEISVWH